jgi:hypothetical protein
MPKHFHGIIQRAQRRREERRQAYVDEALREGEVGQCTECNEVFTWGSLTDFSTQEEYKVLCRTCISKHDPRFVGGQRG